MLFHKPDATFKRLASCWKRAKDAKQGDYSSHPLRAAWSNCCLALENEPTADNIALLDWFAFKVEQFSQKNLMQGDDGLAAILFEWKQRLGFDPTQLVKTA